MDQQPPLPGNPMPGNVVAMAIVFEGGLGLLAFALAWWLEVPLLDYLRWDTAALGWGVVAALPMIAAFMAMRRWPIGPLRSIERAVDELVVPMFRGARLIDLAMVSLLAGVGEELLFRGLLQQVIAERWGLWVGIAAASLAFGLAHPITTSYAVLAGLIGVYLGWLFVACDDSLVAPIVTHAVYDFVGLVYLLKIVDRGNNDE